MALKGFLASGFQKLIGASRIKGSNEQWVGEQNQVTVSGGTFPLSATLVNGFNFVDLTSTGNPLYSTGALFATNPTAFTQVILRNSSGTNNNWTFTNVSTAGGLTLANNTTAVLETGDTLVLVYDTNNSRWREVSRSRSTFYYIDQTITVTGKITLTAGSSNYLYTLNIGTNASYKVTGLIAANAVSTPNGTRVTVTGNTALPTSSSLVLEAYAGASPFVDDTLFYINGDFQVTPGSSITLQKIPGGWVEVSRTNLSY